MTCPLCKLAAGLPGAIVTRLWRYEFGRVIVVTDLHSRRWAMRTLAVPAEHVACGDEDFDTWTLVDEALDAVRDDVEREMGLRWARRDMERHGFAAHFHGQDCYEEVA